MSDTTHVFLDGVVVAMIAGKTVRVYFNLVLIDLFAIIIFIFHTIRSFLFLFDYNFKDPFIILLLKTFFF